MRPSLFTLAFAAFALPLGAQTATRSPALAPTGASCPDSARQAPARPPEAVLGANAGGKFAARAAGDTIVFDMRQGDGTARQERWLRDACGRIVDLVSGRVVHSASEEARTGTFTMLLSLLKERDALDARLDTLGATARRLTPPPAGP